MNILHINSYWSKGGAETILRESIRVLRRWVPEMEHSLAVDADEVLGWLAGDYTFDPACLT